MKQLQYRRRGNFNKWVSMKICSGTFFVGIVWFRVDFLDICVNNFLSFNYLFKDFSSLFKALYDVCANIFLDFTDCNSMKQLQSTRWGNLIKQVLMKVCSGTFSQVLHGFVQIFLIFVKIIFLDFHNLFGKIFLVFSGHSMMFVQTSSWVLQIVSL